jgi:hypothetical protein
LLIATTWVLADRLEDTFYVPLDHPAIQYVQETGDDPVARLEARIESGRVKLDYAANGWGYLPALLQALDIHVDSQVLVFSKTSIQANHISPRTPRAIYFNDNVSVGFVREGEVLEIASLDARQGIRLYSIDTKKADQPELSRRDDCLRCHQGPVTLGVPGLLLSSVHPSTGRRGEEHGSTFMTDHRTPLAERWGGWYVTGTDGSQYNLGNNTNLVDPVHPGGASLDGTQNVTSLADRFDTSKYLAPTSDIVALMVLEHQTRMTNLITRIGWDVRIAQHDGKLKEREKQLDAEIDELTAYMLFGDEALLKDPIAGVSTFSKTFPQRGPRDRQGRSLRDFDLHTRLFRYPLSYMIYSDAFEGMPDFARERVYRRLYDILTGKDTRETAGGLSLARLSSTDRGAILEIVRETKPNLPAYWNAARGVR